jgi:fructosamine-3-kinase
MAYARCVTLALRTALARHLGTDVREARTVAGGDINHAWRVGLADGRAVFVKHHADAPRGMFGCEARGLDWLRAAEALRLPEVMAVSDGDGAGGPAFLALEWIASAAPAPGHDEALGRGLATLHRNAPAGFGLDHDNFIALLPQDNRNAASWPEFYATRRLEPQLRMASDRGRASAAMRRGFQRLFTRMTELCGPAEPPARLHGDLWGGNAMTDERGLPLLIDPAVYGGHREIDLAMMRLFGGFGARVFAAYEEAWPLAPGHDERVALYQLYPLMVHVNLFGGGYADRVEQLLATLA